MNKKKWLVPMIAAGVVVLAAILLIAMKEKKKADVLAARNEKFEVGKYVEFGTYPQTFDGTDQTPIEWLVLDRDGDKALLLSRYGLDAHIYDDDWIVRGATWEKSDIREWLNEDFLNRAFTADEQKGILLSDIDNSESQCCDAYNVSGGNNTQDMVFLLSYGDIVRYFGLVHSNRPITDLFYTQEEFKTDESIVRSLLVPTDYARSQNVYEEDKYLSPDHQTTTAWWLRSPGYRETEAMIVFPNRSPDCFNINARDICVRPALWVDIRYDGF